MEQELYSCNRRSPARNFNVSCHELISEQNNINIWDIDIGCNRVHPGICALFCNIDSAKNRTVTLPFHCRRRPRTRTCTSKPAMERRLLLTDHSQTYDYRFDVWSTALRRIYFATRATTNDRICSRIYVQQWQLILRRNDRKVVILIKLNITSRQRRGDRLLAPTISRAIPNRHLAFRNYVW